MFLEKIIDYHTLKQLSRKYEVFQRLQIARKLPTYEALEVAIKIQTSKVREILFVFGCG